MEARLSRRLRWLAAAAAALCLGAASVALTGWVLGVPELYCVLPDTPRTTFNTAVAMFLIGAAVLLRLRPGSRRRRVAGHVAAGLAIAIALLTLAQYLFGIDLGIDELLVREHPEVDTPIPGRPSPQTAIALILLGTGLLWLRARRALATIAQVALMAGFFLTLVATHAYLHGALALVGPPQYLSYTGMGVLTATGLFAASIGAMFAEPANPVTRWLPEPTPAGTFVRVSGAVLVLVLPFGLASMLAAGRALGLYGSRTLVALFGSTFTIGCAIAVAQLARTIDRRDRERRHLLEFEREAREATELERARLAAVLDSAPIGILVVDARTHVASANHTLSRMLRSKAPGIAAGLGKLLEPGGAPLGREELPTMRVLAGQTLSDESYRILRPDGGSFPVSVDGVPIRGSGGEIDGACLTFYDVSEREKLDQLREQYLSLVSHDLNSPVTSIMMGAELLEEQLESAGLPTRTASLIKRNASRVHGMIEDLNDVTRLEGGMVRLRPRAIAMASFLETVVEHATPPAERDRVRVDVHPAIGTFTADPDLLERLLTNLLGNALRHGEPGTPIELSARLEPEGVLLSVHNRGPALAPDDAKRIFDKHFRVSRERTRGPGLGLGLYISRLIAEAHEGRIWAESPNGEGVTVHVLLPGPSRVAMPLTA